MPDIERRLHRAIAAEAVALGGEVLAINGTENHLHLAVLFPATIRICDFVKQIKGASSRLATTELLQRRVYWQEGYGAFAFSINLAPKITGYIQRQKEHHRGGVNLWPALEETEEHTSSARTEEHTSSARTFGGSAARSE